MFTPSRGIFFISVMYCLLTLNAQIVSTTKNMKNIASDINGNIPIPAIDSK
ncbi:MAG: hypothetical protein ACXVPY_02605 [Bacteroidia bacterium]